MASIEPLLADARRDIYEVLQGAASRLCPTSEEERFALVASFELSLRNRLYDALSKTVVLELAVARQCNVLAGKSPQERFRFFCNCLSEPNFAKALLEQYPFLIRRIVTITSNWRCATLDLLWRLVTSLHPLREAFFSGGDCGPLVAVKTSGDTHCHGQAVHIVTFAVGQRLVYKPRSVAMETGFFDLVGWLNRIGCEPDLRRVRTLDEGDFGWMEFVDAKACRTREEIERFFVRYGAQIALIYLLGGTDLHSENVVAHGDYPILVDLEALFQTPLLPKEVRGATASGWRALRTSVMGALLLPLPMSMAEDGNWIDISALGHREEQLTPFHVPVWHGDGTDRMRLVHERVLMAAGKSLPKYHDSQMQANSYVDFVLTGFGYMYEFLQKQKAHLLSEEGPLVSCLGKPVRHVFRTTAWYSRLLDESYHPRLLTDAIASEAFLHNRLRAGIEDEPWLAAIEDHEVTDLLAGDIPYFVSGVGQGTILNGSEPTGLVLPGDGWKECRARIEAMSDDDRDRQMWLMSVAMADLSAPINRRTRVQTRKAKFPTPDSLLSTAIRVGERICDLAITKGERATWLVPQILNTKRLITDVAGYDVYGGLPGIALFLGHLGAVTAQPRFTRLAIAAISEALELYKTDPRDAPPCGALVGIGGLAYVLLKLSNLVDRPDWFKHGSKMLHKAVKHAGRTSELDIVSGQAGLMVAALAVHCCTNDLASIGRLRPLAQRLKELAISPRKRGEVFAPCRG